MTSSRAQRATRQLGLFERLRASWTKSYVISTVKQRLTKRRCANEVLDAYRDRARCAASSPALIDAARPREGEGIALCATHHRAFGAGILTFDAEGVIHVHLPRKTAGDGDARCCWRTMVIPIKCRAHEKVALSLLWSPRRSSPPNRRKSSPSSRPRFPTCRPH